jgi:superfamily II DNA/RNA helicase
MANESNMNKDNNTKITKVNEMVEWDDVDMNIQVLRGLYSYGFDRPSQIQRKTIPWIIAGRDVIGQAQSGTGKTGAFCVGTLNVIDCEKDETQAVIMSPTHELARQHQKVCDTIGSFVNVRTHLLIGGTPIEEDRSILTSSKPPHVLFACPGRLHDMLRRGYINAKNIRIMCIDEADELLSSCFKEQLYHILQYVNNNMQIALFSATMPDDVKELTKRFMTDPITIYVNSDELTVAGITQFYIALTDDQQKYEVLKDIFSSVVLSQTIIYCNSVKRVEDLADALRQDNFPVSSIHSNFSEDERKDIIEKFINGQTRVLISSDITARGIDVQQVNVVINFDLCRDKHKYLHRIGRSGRWGRKGVAINFITRRDKPIIQEIENYYKTQIIEFPTNYSEELKKLT